MVCYRKTRKWKKCAWSRSLQWFFTSRPSSCGIIKMSRLRLWIMEAVKPVGQLYGSPTALTSQYLAWDRFCTYVVQTPSVERRIFLEQIRPTVTAEPRDQSLMSTRSLLLNHILLSIENKQANIWRIEINSLFVKFPFVKHYCAKEKKSNPSSLEKTERR